MMTPQLLRREIRRLRQSLTPREQQLHSKAAARVFHHSPLFLKCHRIAIYLVNDGELDPRLIGEQAFSAGKKLFLPVLRPNTHRSLWFASYTPGEKLITNAFGIPEPDIRKNKIIAPWALDLILMPLVAFDPKGNRLGMGGGYYDRTLNYLQHRRHWRRPHLVGLAHELQRVAHINRNPWDIPMHGVLTEKRYYTF